MAVTANIPGIGVVSVDGAASEATLQALIGAVNSANQSRRRVDNTTADSLKRQANAADEAQASMSTLSKSAGTAAVATSSAMSKINDGFENVSGRFAEIQASASSFGSLMISTAMDIGKEWTRKFDDIRVSPINQAVRTFDTSIQLAATGAKTLGSSFGKLLPDFIGKRVQGGTDAAVDLISGTLSTINQVLGDELNKTIKTQKIFNSAGAVFAGGMSEMRVRAVESGLGLEDFATIVKNNRNDIKAFGGTVADGVVKLNRVTNELSTQTGSSGKALREELLNMGIGLEEQTEITAKYMAQTRQLVGMEKFRTLTTEQLAQGTRKYAEDLKILQEATGKDAKAIMDKARADTQRSSLQARLDEKQSASLTDTFAGLNKFPEEIRGNLQQALIQQLSGGTITDPVVAQSQELTEFIKKLAGNVEAGSGNMVTKTTELTNQLVDTMQKQIKAGDGVFVAAGRVAEFGGSIDANTQKLATFGNALMNMQTVVGDATRTQENLNKTTKSTDPLQEAFNKSQIAASDFAKTMGNLATEALPKYAQMIQATTQATTQAVTASLNFLTGKANIKELAVALAQAVKESLATILKPVEIPRGGQQPQPERRARGGIVETGKNYIVGEEGPELFVAGKDGMILPNSNLKSGLDIDSTKKSFESLVGGLGDTQSLFKNQMNIVKGIQDNFSATIATQQKQKEMQSSKPADLEPITELPSAITKAIEEALNGPAGFNQAVNGLKLQLQDGDQEQIMVLKQQVDKLTELISMTQDNLRINERIANEIS